MCDGSPVYVFKNTVDLSNGVPGQRDFDVDSEIKDTAAPVSNSLAMSLPSTVTSMTIRDFQDVGDLVLNNTDLLTRKVDTHQLRLLLPLLP